LEDLVKKAQKGNSQAYLTLFQKYEQDIYRMAFLYVKNESDALDVVQETAYRSFKTIKKLKESTYFKTWLIRIAINCSLDLLKKQRNISPMSPEYEDEIIGEVNEDIELKVTVEDLMEYLNEEEKSVVILRFYEDLTINDISLVLDIPLGTAKTILYRSLARLRKSLRGGEIDE
jgi:RNA polymerase sigma-70 factor, ECF subfamily